MISTTIELERHRTYYQANRERLKECARKRYRDDPGKVKAGNQRWADANPEASAEIKRRWAERNKERRAEVVRQWQEKSLEKRRAHVILNNAIQSGRVQRQPCQVCGAKAQAHHDDYSKPLEVRWLCPKHHGKLHRKIQAACPANNQESPTKETPHV